MLSTIATLFCVSALTFVSAQDDDELLDTFTEADVNGDGKVSFEELLQIQDVDDTTEDREMFAAIDTSGDGFISFDEFVAYAQSHNDDDECAAHSDCPSDLPFCYDGNCDLCSECHYCDDGIDGTCGNCGDGFPTREDKQCKAQDVITCEAHSDCPSSKPFCFDDNSGEMPSCDSCSECEYCWDGVDGTCGECGIGYPLKMPAICGEKCAAHTDCPPEAPFCYDGDCSPCADCEVCDDGIDGTCGPCETDLQCVDDDDAMTEEEMEMEEELFEAKMAQEDEDEQLGFPTIKSSSAKSAIYKTEDEFIAAEKAKENSYSAKSSISKAMGDDMSEYRKIIQQELDEDGDTETDAEMDAQLKVIAQLANEKTSSAKTYSAKALGEDESTWSPPRYSDVSSAKYTGSYGLGHRGYKDLYSSAKSSVSTVDDADAEEKENYKRLIRKQLDEENEDETDEEMDANVKVVMQLAREDAAKKGKKTKSVKPVVEDADADTDIESKVIAALRKAGKVKPEGMSESDIAIKIMEGLDDLVNAGEE